MTGALIVPAVNPVMGPYLVTGTFFDRKSYLFCARVVHFTHRWPIVRGFFNFEEGFRSIYRASDGISLYIAPG